MLKVMVVDDEKDTVCLVKYLMEREKLEVVEASNGLEAYARLTSGTAALRPPDAIILDVMMPEMDGYTFHTKLQETEGLQDIPIVILSAKDKLREMFSSSSNIFAFVEKPIEAKTLVDTVKAAMDSRKSRGFDTLNNPANSGRMIKPPLN